MTLPQQILQQLPTDLIAALGASCECTRIEALPAQASNRRYFRLFLQGSTRQTVLLMLLPEDLGAFEEVGAQGTASELPFVNVQRFLAGLGLPVPEILRDRTAQRFLLLEDLGTETLLDAARTHPEQALEKMGKAVDLLADFHRAVWSVDPQTGGVIGFTRRFDVELLRWELDHFREWLLEAFAGANLSPDQSDDLDTVFSRLVDQLVAAPYRLAHRDFQSTNLIPGKGRLSIIDFQDALMGPWVYDSVALLRDSYWVLEPPELEGFKRRYFNALGDVAPETDYAAFDRLFRIQTLQRKLKDAGRFVFIDRQKGNPRFLQYIPDTLAYVQEALSGLPEASALHRVLAEVLPAHFHLG